MMLLNRASFLLCGLLFAIFPRAHAASVFVTVNSLAANATTIEPGQTVTFVASLTASKSVSGYPVEFSWIAPGASSGPNAVVYLNYQANQPVTATASWSVPAGSAAGSYQLLINQFDPAWNVPVLASASTSFNVSTSTSPQIPGPSSTLYAKPFYTCKRSFYVSTTGKDSNTGTEASPWLTIQHADTSSRQAGDCVMVAPGTYEEQVLILHGGNAPTATGYVAYRCETLDQCHVLAPRPGHLWGFANGGNFVVVDGFQIDGNNALMTNGIADACFGSDAATYGTGKSSHHIWIINNIIHHCNLAGVSFNNKEWYYVLQNTIYHNSWTSGYQGSGIGFVVVQCIEANNPACATGSTYKGGTGTYIPSGMDLTYKPPFHNVVSGNTVFHNMIAPQNPVPCGAHTDGNGIIMDTFLDMATLSIVFPYQTLVSNNISFLNGGRGIHVFRTSNVTVANNSVYGNGTDTCISAYYLGDLSQAGGSNNVWINNIAQSVMSPANPYCGPFCGNRNAPLVAGNAAGITDNNNSYFDNITFDGLGVQLFNNDVSYFSCSNNKCKTNPLFVNASSGNFALGPDSPAIGYGKIEDFLQENPLNGGACSSLFSTCP